MILCSSDSCKTSHSNGVTQLLTHCGMSEIRRSDAMNTPGANKAEQAERGPRVLYVLSASLALAAIAMIAVALTA